MTAGRSAGNGRKHHPGRARRVGGLVAALLLLAPAACGGETRPAPSPAAQSTPPAPLQVAAGAGEPPPPIALPDGGRDGFGRYLAGRMAQSFSDTRGAAQFYLDALNADPDNLNLLRRAWFYLVAEGRTAEAVPLAERTIALEPAATVAPLVVAVDRVARGDFAAAHAAVAGLEPVGLNSFMVPLVAGWALAGAGRTDDALAALAAMDGQAAFDQMRAFHGGLILDLAGHAQAAGAAYRLTLEDGEGLSLRSVEVVADFLRRQGRSDEAAALIGRYRDRHPGSMMIAAVEAAHTGAPAGGAAGRPIASVADGLAEALYGAASSVMQSNAHDTALVFVRLALHLRPDFPYAQMMLGDLLQAADRPAEAAAAYGAIAADSAVAFPLGLRLAETLERMERPEEALAALDSVAATYAQAPEPLVQKGDVLRRLERWDEAAAAYRAALDRIGPAGEQARHWTIHYSLGVSLERGKRWPEAEQAFRRALDLEPDQPLVLNYLGYSWIDRGMHLAEGKALIEKAVRQRPTDGFIIDSLGWAHYLLGDYPAAVRELERAVELTAGDPTINDHLGDAYWRVGRHLEARFQWERALVLKPEPDQVEAIRRKLADGLPDAPPPRAGQ